MMFGGVYPSHVLLCSLMHLNSTLKTKVSWSNKEKVVDPTMSNLANQVSQINQVCWLVKQNKVG